MRYRIIALSHLQRQPFNKVCNERKSALSRDKIAVIIPCYNEALTIGKVIDDFRRELPEASVYVYDNNSTDGTAKIARESGAIVRHEPRQGKGNVCRQMFRDIDADCYLMVDADETARDSRKAKRPLRQISEVKFANVCEFGKSTRKRAEKSLLWLRARV